MQEGPDPGALKLGEVQAVKTQQPGKAILIAFCFCAGAFILDRLTKLLVMRDFLLTRDLIPGLLAITKHHNLGLLGDTTVPSLLMYGLNAAAFAVLVYAMVGHAGKRENAKLYALAVVLGGAVGNLYDRAVYGYVFDWLMFFNLTIINLADAFITIGLVAYAWLVFKRDKHEAKEDVV